MDPFWVDLYIDPAMAPTAVNQIWPDLSDEGLVWGVTDPIPPGGTLILTYSADPDQTHLYYNDEQSRYGGDLPPGTPIYAQVDSYHPDTDYGSVREGDEMGGGGYNNISGGISSRIITLPEVGFPAADSGPPADRGLPPR